MRNLPLEEDARAVLKPYFPFLSSVMAEAITATCGRIDQDRAAGYEILFPIQRTWSVWSYAASIFKRREDEHPGMKVRMIPGTFLITVEGKFELWVRLVDHTLTPAANRTEGSEALTQNGALYGFSLPTLILGYRFNSTATGLGSLNIICIGKKNKRAWAIDVLNDASTGTLPFQVAPAPTAPTQTGREIRAKVGLTHRKKAANGSGSSENG